MISCQPLQILPFSVLSRIPSESYCAEILIALWSIFLHARARPIPGLKA